MNDTPDIVRNTFDNHRIARETGWTWSCRRPGTSAYAYRVTWCPFNLVVTGDIGEIVITHYSFKDPWSAAAWINGAGFHYFMEKSNVAKEYDPEATAKGIVEDAYRQLRDGRAALMERIVEEYGSWNGDADTVDGRKYACREMLSSEVDQNTAYTIAEDSESLVMSYPTRSQWHYRALKLWANWMWENEPAWHVAARWLRQILAEYRELKKRKVLFAPVIYVKRDASGRLVRLNGDTHWRWVRHADYYSSIRPVRLFGRTWGWLGLWRDSGNRWNDRLDDVRPEWRSKVMP